MAKAARLAVAAASAEGMVQELVAKVDAAVVEVALEVGMSLAAAMSKLWQIHSLLAPAQRKGDGQSKCKAGRVSINYVCAINSVARHVVAWTHSRCLDHRAAGVVIRLALEHD